MIIQRVQDVQKNTDARGFRHLKRLVKDDAGLNMTKITSDLNASLAKPVTTRIVRSCLKELIFEYVVKVKKKWVGVQQRIA